MYFECVCLKVQHMYTLFHRTTTKIQKYGKIQQITPVGELIDVRTEQTGCG